jgi:hypothetical protein
MWNADYSSHPTDFPSFQRKLEPILILLGAARSGQQQQQNGSRPSPG